MVTLITRVDCHLCEEARAAVAATCAAAAVDWVEIDVDGDPETRAEYGDRVPVVLINGTEHAHFRIESERLAAELATAAPRATGR